MRAWKVTPVNSGANPGKQRFNALEFSPDPPDEMGSWLKGGATPAQVVEETNQYFKHMHEHCFHAGNASGPVPENSIKSIRTEFLVGTTTGSTSGKKYFMGVLAAIAAQASSSTSSCTTLVLRMPMLVQ